MSHTSGMAMLQERDLPPISGSVRCLKVAFTILPEACASRQSMWKNDPARTGLCAGPDCARFDGSHSKAPAPVHPEDLPEPKEEGTMPSKKPFGHKCPGFGPETCEKTVYYGERCHRHGNQKMAAEAQADGTRHNISKKAPKARAPHVPAPLPQSHPQAVTPQKKAEALSCVSSIGRKYVLLGTAMQSSNTSIDELVKLAMDCGLVVHIALVPKGGAPTSTPSQSPATITP